MRPMSQAAVSDDLTVRAVRGAARVLAGRSSDYDSLVERVGDARFVLLGEATHGTHEFYRERALITRRLIAEKGFTAVVVEGDWPDAYRVNRFVRGGDGEAIDALGGFRRFPAWMWRNADVLDFVGWLRTHNDDLGRGLPRVGFYGLDLYSLHASMEAVLAYLDKVDPVAAERARARYACFDHYRAGTQAYGFGSGLGLGPSCEREVIAQLIELRQSAAEYALRDGRIAEDDYFYAERNAELVKNAEQYYRTMYVGEVSSWNLRDGHMTETLEALVTHLGTRVTTPKLVVWAHNSHLGDARATEMGHRGEWNVGQLMRERHGADVVSVGFTTYDGTVTAASNWDAPAERKRVRPALRGSYEALFHDVGPQRFLITLDDDRVASLREPREERAIGVIYRPETERTSHYFAAVLPAQFDVLIHLDHTRAVEPMERTAYWEAGEAPETFPSGF